MTSSINQFQTDSQYPQQLEQKKIASVYPSNDDSSWQEKADPKIQENSCEVDQLVSIRVADQ